MRPRPSEVAAAVERAYGLDAGDLLERTRRPEICRPRQVAMWLMRGYGMDYSLIARFFSQHHTTVMHAVGMIAARVGDDEIKEVKVNVDNWWINTSANRKAV